MRLRSDYAWLLYLAALAVFAVVLLVAPRIPDDRQADLCVINITMSAFGLSLSCDSPEFLQLATNPAELLLPNTVRQSRPGLVLAAAALALPLKPLRVLVSHFHVQTAYLNPGTAKNTVAENVPVFVAYFLMNVIFLVMTFYFFRQILLIAGVGNVMDVSMAIIVFAVGFLFVANDVVRGFLWSPHTQVLNIFVPVFGVYLILLTWLDRLHGSWPAAGLGFAIGLGILSYPIFAVLVPCVVLPALVQILRQPMTKRGERLLSIVFFVAASLAPYLVWYLFVRIKTGSFYSHEIANGQVIWMGKAFADGGVGALVTGLWERVVQAVEIVRLQTMPLLLMVAWPIVVVGFLAPRIFGALRSVQMVVLACLFVSTLIIVFYVGVGLIVPRLVYAVIPPLVTLVGACAVALAAGVGRRVRWLVAAGCLVVTAVQTLLVATSLPALVASRPIF
jgi:hypothetical protein